MEEEIEVHECGEGERRGCVAATSREVDSIRWKKIVTTESCITVSIVPLRMTMEIHQEYLFHG
jgi:hypothetical protein